MGAVAGAVRGRWYDAVGGVGLEVQRGEGEWRVANVIETKGKRRVTYEIRGCDDGGAYSLGSYDTLELAKAALVRAAGVTEIVEDCEPVAVAPAVAASEKGWPEYGDA